MAEDGLPNPGVFYFQENHVRVDGLIGESVSWEDDGNAVEFTLAMRHVSGRNAGELQFKGGVAVLPRSDLDHLAGTSMVCNALSYNREALDENPYHGNLLLRPGLPARRVARIASQIAGLVSTVHLQKRNN
jgi:hypothetical protein